MNPFEGLDTKYKLELNVSKIWLQLIVCNITKASIYESSHSFV